MNPGDNHLGFSIGLNANYTFYRGTDLILEGGYRNHSFQVASATGMYLGVGVQFEFSRTLYDSPSDSKKEPK